MAPRKKSDPVERTEICKACRYAHFGGAEGLHCRRYPPAHVYDVSTGITAVAWPEVDADHYCGEFKAQLAS